MTVRARAARPRLGSRYRKLFGASVISNLGDGVATVAYPWLASAITRNPFLVALVAVAQRLPWLVFTLPAGVITDRVDRRKAMVLMDICRGLLTSVVAMAVWLESDSLPKPGDLDAVAGTRWPLFVAVLAATLLLGSAEVLRDNSAQTIVPDLVPVEHLESANGRMWSAEGVANTFVGPPLGSLMIGVAFALPFVIDATSFFAAAALVGLIPGTFRAARAAPSSADAVSPASAPTTSWRAELREGVSWLWAHPVLRPMAIVLGLMNLASMVSGATFVLFAQEVLDVGPFVFAVIGMGGAIGGIVGGVAASWLSKRFGAGTCLSITMAGFAVSGAIMAINSWWPLAFVLFTIESLFSILWNVITVSFRQSIIPPQLLGRVNSVYRFFAWGMMPIGAAIGGVLVAVVDSFASRDLALRSTWVLYAAIYTALWVTARSKLSTARIEAARAAALSTVEQQT